MAETKQAHEPRHLLDLIRELRPKTAIFTTYTFSVGYFDAVFVPVLRAVGCQDIAVLVDAGEAALGAAESRSRAAGRVYRVASVLALGGGVFHPKLAYLAAETDDVLAVSSGNLTASGQSLQLESFDAVSASRSPSVFRDLADWLDRLGRLVEATSPQAAYVLRKTAPRALQAFHNNQSAATGAFPEPTLIHTLGNTAREMLETYFRARFNSVESVVVLSPFHSSDGGPVVRLASSLRASSLAVGLNAGRRTLVAPFAPERFEPGLPTRFVTPESVGATRRLHAKVFELHSPDGVLVMSGSINATSQSFESSKNVEVSLARWLPKSPFEWKDAVPEGYEATQVGSDFPASHALYVDAWIEEDWTLHGQLTSRAEMPASLDIAVSRGGDILFSGEAGVDGQGRFSVNDVPSFDVSEATLLTVTGAGARATCWLNVYEQLDIAIEERERRAAVDRVLRGEYALEDIAEVVRLLTSAAQGIAGGSTAGLRRQPDEARAEAEVPFSFLRWERSGQHRGGATLLGRSPNELLKAITKWMNADLAARPSIELEFGESRGLQDELQLLGGTDEEQGSSADRVDPYELLDRLCGAIPLALERQPGLEYGAVLAEVAASRAVDRTLKEDLKGAPCLSWLDRFSRLSFPDAAREDVCKVATAMGCVTAYLLRTQGQEPQLAVLREAVERFAGGPMDTERWSRLCEAGLVRDLFQRVAKSERDAVASFAVALASVQTLDDGLLTFLAKAWTVPRNFLAREPEALIFPELAGAMRERRPKRSDLLRGLVSSSLAGRKGLGCPFCYQELSEQQLATLKQRHVLVHKGLTCNNVLLLGDPQGRLHQGVEGLPDA